MKNNVITSAIVIVIIIFFLIAVSLFLNNKNRQVDELVEIKKIKIAACPTCNDLIKELDAQKYEVIPTSSTSESIELLADNKVDMILAGRTLKPNESQFDYLIIKEGYSYLSKEGKAVYFDELKNYNIYSDLDINKIPDSLLDLKIQFVENVYDYLDKGIVITSWDNTNYDIANIVHVLEKDGKRSKLSRRPTIYCPNVCNNEARKLANLINN